ncbi:MAG TPA: tetratricopeptide repeat protein, partial [Bryobacteraceae bacterium]|nr:tetratricopeptide repeat protein [Bryobacteraceae bacterium]
PVVVTPATAEATRYLNLSFEACRTEKAEECIALAKKALALNPSYAEAYNNIAAANEALQHWDEAIAAAREALRLRPDFQLAKNNLAWSESQKLKAAGGK